MGVSITDAAVDDDDRTHVFCRLLDPIDTCPGCATPGRLRDHVDREVADLPIVGHPTRLHLRIPRYVCESSTCATSVLRADISAIVAPRAQVTRRTTGWIMRAMVIDKMSVTSVAAAVGLSGNTVNTLAADAARKIVAAPGHLARCGSSGSMNTHGNTFVAAAIRVS